MHESIDRRSFLERALVAAGIGCFGNALVVPMAHSSDRDSGAGAGAGADDFGPLLEADENGLRLPAGFSSRVVAQSGQVVGSTSHVWHAEPDGGATFATSDGGWVYVSNAEIGFASGGVGAIRFAADGKITDAYSILTGTERNCAGGPTPWQTWLSGEEFPRGRIWECDPLLPGSQGISRPALGVFKHEAAAVDPVGQHVYLTEDEPTGLLYRFTPTSYPNLATGTLEAAQILDHRGQGPIAPGQTRSLAWHAVPDPSAAMTPTRFQILSATPFNGGEGCWYGAGCIYFSTKGDNRVWQIDMATSQIEILYDFATASNRSLSGVDNLFFAPTGDVYVAEDGGDFELIALTPSGQVKPILQMMGQAVSSEVTGPALSPDGKRLYVSSQRVPGRTYEISGPFIGTPAVPISSGAGALTLAAALGVGKRLNARSRERNSNAP